MSFSAAKGWITKPKPGVRINPLHPLSRGLVGYWLFNEGAGSVVHDISGYGNHGTLKNMAPNAQNSGWGGSKFGGGLEFDGADDYVEVSYDSILDNSSTFTMEAWFKSNIDGDQYSEIAFIIDMGFFADRGYGIFVSEFHNWEFVSYYNAVAVDSNVVANAGQRYHLVTTYNGTSLKIFVDGTEGGSVDVSQGTIDNEPLRIGTQSKSLDRYFNGSVGSVRIYNRALSAAEVKQLYRDPFCNLLRVPVRYAPAAVIRELVTTIATGTEVSAADLKVLRELISTIATTTFTSASNALMLRELISTIATGTSVSAADLKVLHELSATIAVQTTLSDIELFVTQLRELAATVAAITSTSAVDMNVVREIDATIASTTTISTLSLDVIRELVATLATQTGSSGTLDVLRELLSTVATTTSTSEAEMKVIRELEAIIAAAATLSAIELLISMWITSDPSITKLKSEGWFE